jgi:hypothetical protein
MAEVVAEEVEILVVQDQNFATSFQHKTGAPISIVNSFTQSDLSGEVLAFKLLKIHQSIRTLMHPYQLCQLFHHGPASPKIPDKEIQFIRIQPQLLFNL